MKKFFDARKGSPEEGTTSPVNLTPLIDVSLVLVVILLLATPLAFESSISLKRAQSTGRTAEKEGDRLRIEVHLLSEDRVQVNREETTLANLESALKPLIERTPDAPVVMRCDDDVTHGAFVTALDETKAAGVNRIAVMGERR